MTATLYVVPGSHPCAAVERALELKGIAYDRVDLLPVAHIVQQRLRFPSRTVPALVLDGGEKVQGTTTILRRLDELVDRPPLLPSDPPLRREVLQAERWGDEVLQPIARRLSWAVLSRASDAMPSYAEGANLPIPDRLAALGGGIVAAAAARINAASDENVRADLVSLPHHLDRVDRWIETEILGRTGEPPSAADLQIGSSLRLMLTFGDVAPLIEGRAAGILARTQFPRYPGSAPAGTLPAGWVPTT